VTREVGDTMHAPTRAARHVDQRALIVLLSGCHAEEAGLWRTDTNCRRRASRPVLGAHKVPGAGVAGDGDPALRALRRHNRLGDPDQQSEQPGRGAAFALGAGATRVYREGGVLHVEVPRDTARKVALPGAVPPAADGAAVLCGVGGRRRRCAAACCAWTAGRGARAGGRDDRQRQDGAGAHAAALAGDVQTIRGSCSSP